MQRIQNACMLSSFSRVRLFATPWTVACQAPLSMGFSRQEYWSGLSCPSPGDLHNPRTESMILVVSALQADSLPLSLPRDADTNWDHLNPIGRER